jgi:mono/diheme cytochrome c family protein
MRMNMSWWALLFALVFSACAPTMSVPSEYVARPISVEAGRDYFLTTGGGDPYAAGIAYPVFLALMDAYPEELGRDWNEFAQKFGMIPDPDAHGDPKAPPIGFHVTTDPNTGVPWLVANCQMCHADRLRLPSGDLVVPGLGNKRVRPHAYMAAISRIGASPTLSADRLEPLARGRAQTWGLKWRYEGAITRATIDGLRTYARTRAPLVSKMGDAIPGRMGTIESFALMLGQNQRKLVELPSAIGWAKVPDVRGFPFRETFSYDASGFGAPTALVLEADFLFGVRPEWYLAQPHIATSMYMYLRKFRRTLPFPRPVDTSLAKEGRTTFERACAGCHGFYVDHGDEMRVSYRERVIPLAEVGTDPARVNAVTEDFVRVANSYALSRGYTRVENTGGYVPPILLDVWARGVLGHAGQWPSLEVLATPPAERPVRFIVDVDGMYDLDRVGVRYEVAEPSPARRLRPSEYLYDGTTPGLGVGGHPYLAKLAPDQRKAVIEYLKTL